MRTFKILSIFVFLAVFINGKANASILGIEIKKGHSSKEIKADQKISNQDKDEDSSLKHKRRPRGVEVDVPNIADTSFERSFTYTPFTTQWTRNIFTSFLYHVDLKRGPPLS